MRYSNSSLVGVAEANGLYVLRHMRGEVLGHLGVNNAFALDTAEGAAKEAARWHFRLAHLGAEAVHRLSLEDNDIPSIWKVPRCVLPGLCVWKNGKDGIPVSFMIVKSDATSRDCPESYSQTNQSEITWGSSLSPHVYR